MRRVFPGAGVNFIFVNLSADSYTLLNGDERCDRFDRSVPHSFRVYRAYDAAVPRYHYHYTRKKRGRRIVSVQKSAGRGTI